MRVGDTGFAVTRIYTCRIVTVVAQWCQAAHVVVERSASFSSKYKLSMVCFFAYEKIRFHSSRWKYFWPFFQFLIVFTGYTYSSSSLFFYRFVGCVARKFPSR